MTHIQTTQDHFTMEFADVPAHLINRVMNRLEKMITGIRPQSTIRALESSVFGRLGVSVVLNQAITFYEIQSIAVLATGIVYQIKFDDLEDKTN